MDPVIARIRGKKYYFPSKRELARFLMDLLLKDPLISFENRLETLYQIMDFTGFPNKAKWVGCIKTENRYTKAYWEVLLSLEGLSTLPGFSVDCPIEKGDSCYNPEKRRMSTDWVFLEGNK